MDQKELKKLSLLAEVACDYYERGLTQNEIADKLFLSRTRVSRLLKEAVDRGIISFTINYTFERHYELEERLKTRFGLKHARVLNNRNREKFLAQNVCKLGAEYLTEHIKKNMIIGVGWGNSLALLTNLLKPMDASADVVQLTGSLPCEGSVSTPQAIVTSLTETLHGHANFLNLPLYIEDDYARSVLCNDRNNSVILKKGIFCDKILANLATPEQVKESDYWRGCMPPELYEELMEKEACGAILGRFFDENGKEIDCRWNEKTIGLSIRQLKNIPDVIVVAAPATKAAALMAALKGGFIDTLITDGTTATCVLNATHPYPS